MDQYNIYICKTDCTLLGTLTGLKTETCSLVKNAMDLWELTFDIDKYVNDNGTLTKSSFYDSAGDMMKLYMEGNDVQAFFIIDSEPVIRGGTFQEVKSITAHSIECELGEMYLKNFKVNCGTADSQEYLACTSDPDGNKIYYNVNPYTGLPNEYVSLINYEDTQLSLLHLVLQGTGWTVKEGIDPELCRIKKSFETSGSVYSFLMKTISPAASVIFEFDRKNRQIGAVRAERYGNDTGVFISMRNLINSFEVTASGEDNIKTKLIPRGADDIGIEFVNFGQDSLLNLDYFMNTPGEYGGYTYVSSELHDKYNLWKNYRDKEKTSLSADGKTMLQGTRREIYRELTKLYNKTITDISELHNRLPNDGCLIDYRTYGADELKTAYTAYNKALNTLITLYKQEYNVTEIGNAPDYAPLPPSAANIQDTPYWYDFYAYKEKIIPSIEEALKMYCRTDNNGSLVYDENGKLIELESGNPHYYADPDILKEVNSYVYEWSLYGLDELEAKKKAWSETANLLFHECFILSGTALSPKRYRTPDESKETGWNSLSAEQKKLFSGAQAYINKLNQYLDYMSFDSRENSLTKTTGKGIIRQCEAAMRQRINEISLIESRQKEYDRLRNELAASVTPENFKVHDTLLFTEKDLAVMNSLIREQEFHDDTILTTSLDDLVSTADVQEELYQSAAAKLYEISRPQYSFRTELDNLFSLEEFKACREPFQIGNFIRVGLETHEELCDNNFIRLRLISVSYNPLQGDENLSVEFSTMTKSLNGISDLAFLLDSENSSSAASSSGASSGGSYGNHDTDVQLSNNMLHALLRTELFGTAVTDVILDSMKANKGNFNTLFSHCGAFDSLEAGQIKISGDCLFDRIKSKNWNGTDSNPLSNSQGSIFQLSDGKFNLGGNLKWDGSALTINGTGKFTGEIQGTGGTFYGDVTANTLTANQSGSIAGWQFNENGFYKSSDSIAGDGMYLGNDGISAGDFFVVKKEGIYIKSKDWTPATFSSRIGQETIGSLFTLTAGQYIKVYLYNMANIDYFELSWNYDETYKDSAAGATKQVFDKYCLRGWGVGRVENVPSYYYDGDDIFVFTLSYDFICSIIRNNGLNPARTTTSVNFHLFYSLGRKMDDNHPDRWFHKIQIGKIEVYDSDNTLREILYGNRTNTPTGMMVNTFAKHIYTDTFSISNNELQHAAVYHSAASNSPNLYINPDGRFMRSSSSSQRFKKDITSEIPDSLSPEKLYELDIVSYKYKDNYLYHSDERYGKDIIGLIAEDVHEKYPSACNLDGEGKPEMWNINILFPAALKLIQEQHKELEKLKERIEILEQKG